MLKSLRENALKNLPAKAHKAHRNLIKGLASHISEEDAQHFNAELFDDMVASQWNLTKERIKAAPKISIHCPVIENTARRKTVIDIVSDDLAFLIDSVAATININTFLIDVLVHPVFYAKYDKNGKIEDISTIEKDGYDRQSHIHIHVRDTLSDEDLAQLERNLYESIYDVAIANRDWKLMLARLKDSKTELEKSNARRPKEEIACYADFIAYLYNNNFTLLGYREYEFIEKDGNLISKTIPGKSLGVLHGDMKPAYISENKEGLPRNLQELRRALPPVSISKTNRISTVHRRVPMDAIAIKTYDKNGKITGEKLFLGLLTSVTYSRSVSDVPYLREKVERIMNMSNFTPGTHNRKALRHILERYPRDELFQIEDKQLYEVGLSILRLQERQRTALFLRKDSFGRYISCLVYVPRERFGTILRKKMTTLLEEKLGGTCAAFYTNMDDSVFARVLFTINISQKNPPKYNAAEIEKQLQELGQSWAERLADALAAATEDDQLVTKLTLKYGEAFPFSYTERYSAHQALFDLKKIENLRDGNTLEIDLYQPEDLNKNQIRLKVYHQDSPLTLSNVIPILENMGLRTISELPFEIDPEGENSSIWIHDFLLELPVNGHVINIKEVKENFEEAFKHIWLKNSECDPLCKLVLSANMTWQEITILRTYTRYLRQSRLAYSQNYIQRALTNHSGIARLLVDLFKTSFDPSDAKNNAKTYAKKIERALEKVESLDYDRILRSLETCINATLRTNFFQTDENGEKKPCLSIKLDSKKLPFLPDPKPVCEIFVYSTRVEAIHLRGDKIARGGLRWSDRHEDFRTEVLGLMKAQMVKNAVIVPMGSKGGFVVKAKTKNRDEFMAEGIACYKIFINGLLDITDNLKGETVIPPKDVVRRDGDDPYLVVAADKGTATFSDIANGISQDRNFWLGDAFASGGSAGYDHKKMGITARGAWESVKLHFRQLGHDTQTNPFNVVGVGDMGGDVFGNGMLLSRHIQLIGAFNHLHIFCDPEPDAAISFKERKRLFDNVLGWDHYDTQKLSKGGQIFSRADKTLKLTPEIQKRFDIEESNVSPNDLIRAMLKSRTDLLWFGGIGTYIKSENESHADAGDKANDPLRINGKDLRTKVIGEGANLGVTQLGRIEFAKAGGKINTDFIDNSAGVDSSDHEVNIKILMTRVMAGKTHNMSLKDRNQLLEKMTNEVAEHVLRHNYQQAQAISLAELDAAENLEAHNDLVQILERTQGLNRAIEFLPDMEEIDKRRREGHGLTRPELCVLLSYAKIAFTQDLLASDIPDNKDMQSWLLDYFPDILQTKFSKEIHKHKLKREIIAMAMANSVVNRMGPTFIKSCMKKTGANVADIAKAYIIVREAFQLRGLWDEIEALDNKVPAAVQLRAMNEIASLAEYEIIWFLNRLGTDLSIGKEIDQYSKKISELSQSLTKLVSDDLRENIEMRTQNGIRNGLSRKIAQQIAILPVLASAADIVKISIEQKADMHKTAQTYFKLGKRFQFDWLRQQARFMESKDHWAQEAQAGLINQLYGCQAGLTVRILSDMDKKSGNKDITDEWLKENDHQVRQLDPLFTKLRSGGTLNLAKLIIAEQRLRELYL